jgi:hypothetical protein
MYRRYLGVLASGGAPKGSPARAAYDRLCEGLSGENVATRIYSKGLRAFLDWIERFFGDVGMADRTLFPHAFGLKTPAPLWTAPAFDCCLLLALIYPIATIVLIWAISGHVGPAEAALGLKAGTPGWRRAVVAALIPLSLYGYWQFMRAQGWREKLAWLAVDLALGGAVAVAVALGGAGAIGFAVAFAIERKRQGIFLIVFVLVMIALCIGLPAVTASAPHGHEGDAMLLFLGLLTLSTRHSTGHPWV